MNDELRKQLAEKDAEIEFLNKCHLEQMSAVQIRLVENKEQLAASQAREQQLREAFEQIGKLNKAGSMWLLNLPKIAESAIAIPKDTTALSDMITIAGEVMRERCHAEIPAADMDGSGLAIRALPGVTLEDLK